MNTDEVLQLMLSDLLSAKDEITADEMQELGSKIMRLLKSKIGYEVAWRELRELLK